MRENYAASHVSRLAHLQSFNVAPLLLDVVGVLDEG